MPVMASPIVIAIFMRVKKMSQAPGRECHIRLRSRRT
jgi:hypothetical protein